MLKLMLSLVAIHVSLNVIVTLVQSHLHKRRNLMAGDPERIQYILRDLLGAPDRRKHKDTDKHFLQN